MELTETERLGDQINTLLATQATLVDRQQRIRLMAESCITLCGTGLMFRDVREAFQKIARAASWAQP